MQGLPFANQPLRQLPLAVAFGGRHHHFARALAATGVDEGSEIAEPAAHRCQAIDEQAGLDDVISVPTEPPS